MQNNMKDSISDYEIKVGEMLRIRREKKNLTQKELEAQMQVQGFDDISSKKISRHENGKSLTITVLRTYATFYKISIHSLIPSDEHTYTQHRQPDEVWNTFSIEVKENLLAIEQIINR